MLTLTEQNRIRKLAGMSLLTEAAGQTYHIQNEADLKKLASRYTIMYDEEGESVVVLTDVGPDLSSNELYAKYANDLDPAELDVLSDYPHFATSVTEKPGMAEFPFDPEYRTWASHIKIERRIAKHLLSQM